MMFVAASSRTMASARPKFRQPDAEVIDSKRLEILRAEREVAKLEEIARRRDEAVKSILMANLALGRMRSGRNYTSMAMVIIRICRILKVSKAELLSDRRHKELVFARQAVMYWTLRLTGLSLPEIGKRLGDRDHTTVLHGGRAYRAKRAKQGRILRPAR